LWQSRGASWAEVTSDPAIQSLIRKQYFPPVASPPDALSFDI
jgi:hypothetical protein